MPSWANRGLTNSRISAWGTGVAPTLITVWAPAAPVQRARMMNRTTPANTLRICVTAFLFRFRFVLGSDGGSPYARSSHELLPCGLAYDVWRWSRRRAIQLPTL